MQSAKQVEGHGRQQNSNANTTRYNDWLLRGCTAPSAIRKRATDSTYLLYSSRRKKYTKSTSTLVWRKIHAFGIRVGGATNARREEWNGMEVNNDKLVCYVIFLRYHFLVVILRSPCAFYVPRVHSTFPVFILRSPCSFYVSRIHSPQRLHAALPRPYTTVTARCGLWRRKFRFSKVMGSNYPNKFTPILTYGDLDRLIVIASALN